MVLGMRITGGPAGGFGETGGDHWRTGESIKCHKNSGCKTDVRNKSWESIYCWEAERFSWGFLRGFFVGFLGFCVLLLLCGVLVFCFGLVSLPYWCLGEWVHVQIAHLFGTVALAPASLLSPCFGQYTFSSLSQLALPSFCRVSVERCSPWQSLFSEKWLVLWVVGLVWWFSACNHWPGYGVLQEHAAHTCEWWHFVPELTGSMARDSLLLSSLFIIEMKHFVVWNFVCGWCYLLSSVSKWDNF